MKHSLFMGIVIILTLALAGVVQGDLTDGLEVYYDLDDNTKTSVGTYNGVNTGAIANQSGLINNSYLFDGNNDYIAVTTNPLMWSGINWTMSTWFWLNDTLTAENYLVYEQYAVAVRVGDNSDNVITLTDRNTYTEARSSTNVYNNETWNHLAITWGNSTGATIYMNGVDVTADSIVNIQAKSSETLYIARVSTTSAFKGLIDEFAIWNKTLTVREVLALNNSGNGRQYPFNPNTIYVSNSGDDANSGLNPANAIKTIKQANDRNTYDEDFILFDRGNIWRMYDDERIYPSDNLVSYGAYGIGSPPIMSGSMNNSAWTNTWGNVWKSDNTYATDVGQLWFYNNGTYGIKKDTFASVTSQGHFWHNDSDNKVYMYSTSNPSTFYGEVEIVGYLSTQVSDGNNYTLENMTFENSCIHSIGCTDCKNVVVRENIFKQIGGCFQSSTLRYGNAIQFSLGSENILVEYNNITQVYDAGITPQAWFSAGPKNMYNFIARYNLIDKAFYGWEYFNQNATSRTENISIYHNTFVNTGYGFSGADDGRTYSKALRNSYGRNIVNYSVYDNLEYNSENIATEVGSGSISNWGGEKPYLDYNLFYDQDHTHWYGANLYVTLADFQATGNESNSIESDPLFVSGTYQPSYSSSACSMSTTGSYIGAVPCFTSSSCIDADGDGFNASVTDPVCGSAIQLDCDDTNSSILPAYEDMTLTAGSYKICKNTYNLADANGNGAIIIGGDDVYLDLGDSYIYGDSIGTSYAIRASTRDNFVVFNGTVSHYRRNMWITNGDGAKVYNITSFASNEESIKFSNNDDIEIYDCRILNSTGMGIEIENQGIGFEVYNNYIINTGSYGLSTTELSYNGLIYNNHVENTSSTCMYIWDNVKNVTVYENTLKYCGYNGLMFGGHNLKAYNNYLDSALHNIFDIHNNTKLKLANENISFYNNTVTQTNSLYSTGLWAISVFNANNVSIYDNLIENVTNSSRDVTHGRGILITYENLTYNINIYNNTLKNLDGNCIDIRSINTTIQDNTISSCDYDYNIENSGTFPGVFVNPVIKNNNYLDDYVNIYNNDEYVNFTFNGTPSVLKVNLSNGDTRKWIGFGRKALTVENTTVIVEGMINENIVFDSTASTPIHQNIGNITMNDANGDRVFIIQYTAGQPYPSQIDTTVTDIEYSASVSSTGMTLVGIGNAELIGLSIYVGTGGYYEVVRNGVTYSYETTDTYSLPSPGVFLFRTSTYTKCEGVLTPMIDSYIDAMGELPVFFGLIIIIAISVFLLMNRFSGQKADNKIVITTIWGLMVAALMAVLFSIILLYLKNACI